MNLVLTIWQKDPAPVMRSSSETQILKLLIWHLNADQKQVLYGPVLPTIQVLRRVVEHIEVVTFILFNEFIASGGTLDKGEARALRENSAENPHLIFREFSTNGSGVHFVVSSRNQ